MKKVRNELIDSIRGGMDPDEVIDKMARTFSVLGDATRMRIISALSGHELCVAEIALLLNMSPSAISHQMRALKDLDLVKHRKEGRRSYYSLNDIHIENLFEEGLKHVLEKV